MHWNSVADFLAMDGHGAFVWGAYAVTALCIAAEIWLVARGNPEP